MPAMTIRVLVVDDKRILAKNLEGIVNGFKSRFANVSYIVKKTIFGSNTFDEARAYIQEYQEEIDMMMVDYNLDSDEKGEDLLDYVNPEKLSIYILMNSVTKDSLLKTQYIRGIKYDDFCESKLQTAITKHLDKYESEILAIKLFGNPEWRNSYMLNEFREQQEITKLRFGGIPIQNILYAKTANIGSKQITAYYYSAAINNKDEVTRSTHTINDFRRTGLPFKRISQSVFINLLWVAKIDISNKKIRFITPGNIIVEMADYEPSEIFYEEVLPFIHNIDKEIPTFFKK
jgi:hypothetical protein